MRTHLRMAAATVVATAALTAAAPLAMAAQPRSGAPVPAAVSVADGAAVELSAAELAEIRLLSEEIVRDAQQENAAASGVSGFSAKGEAGKKLIGLLKKSPGLFKGAISKAKEGKSAFDSWMKNQNWAVRAAWWALSSSTQTWVLEELIKMVP
ncbi:hypothetical protein ABTZ03_02965 [Kitasatospora sp. NPDC096077]|uniref:hypothetical protein n=1 Tax=Kitasatospora sp. NPDC096077 TaxID=3155544 RepID=UPI003331496D